MLLLAGDIGGTNTRLCLVRIENDGTSFTTIRETVYSSSQDDFVPIVEKFLGQEDKPEKACFAVAGPVLNNKCKLTNLHWSELDGEKLQKDLHIPKVSLINDFVAVGYNIVLESDEQKTLETLQIGEPSPTAPIGIIGAGTGLGQAFAIPKGNSYQVFPTEGGHVDFAPQNDLESELLKYLRKDGKVDVEGVVSGPGIVEIFRFLREYKFDGEAVENIEEDAAAIAKAAGQGNILCQETMGMFVEAYGSAVGNMAVSFLPFGGIYIAGGIAAQNLNLMKDGRFMAAFSNKARVNPALLAKIPVHIVVNTMEGLMGAVKYAAQIM
ncbi:glucokinase [Limnofasciculus baicalensis]|uniref:Glucokinase n=1 Tax=Limnofasciculus baicalensis BBK-W-15 TaxID=2699891 RepID=A0AAE3GR31_9CYAN|nr:glucokinase [Limnofasciculus baicalensis]MCP2729155.1 glucokinase [Limnofasciculus baicalensis BBK-W-15]